MSDLWQEQVKRDRDPKLEEINRLALERIAWMQQQIAEKYHLRLYMGTELETVMLDKSGKSLAAEIKKNPKDKRVEPRPETHFSDPSDLAYDRTFKQAVIYPALSNTTARLWERAYVVGDENSIEIVTGYAPSDKDREALHDNPAAKESFSKKEARYRLPTYQAKLADRIKQYIHSDKFMQEQGLSAVRLRADKPMLAFQPSISVWDEQGHNLFYKSSDAGHGSYSRLAEICAEGTVLMQKEMALLGANYPESYQQYEFKDRPTPRKSLHASSERSSGRGPVRDTQDSVNIRGSGDAATTRVENRLPRADSDPILAVLQSVAGVYYALEKNATIVDHPEADKGHVYSDLGHGKWLMLPDENSLGNHRQKMVGSHVSNHATFEYSWHAKQLLGPDLHAKISAYFSPKAIKAREADLAKGSR